MFVSSTYRITAVHYTYGCAILCAANAGYLYLENHCPTLSAAYVCMFYLQNFFVTLHLGVHPFKCILC